MASSACHNSAWLPHAVGEYTDGVLHLLLTLAALLFGADAPSSLKADVVLLTRPDCVNTPDMQINLDEALSRLKWPHDFATINITTLSKSDIRAHYPTPTLLWKGKDIFGMPVPKPFADTPS